jgi:uncharacterized membrane protein YuzA (DUF378 family)
METTMEPTSTMRNAGLAALVLTIIGAINWLLVGLFRFNLVSAIFGDMSTLSRIVYVLVGLSGLYLIASAGSFLPRASRRGTTDIPARREPVT